MDAPTKSHISMLFKQLQVSTSKDLVNSFQQFQATIKSSLKIFDRPALVVLYHLFTAGNSAEKSFMKPSQIWSGNNHQTWCTIHMGACAAICSVRQELECKDNAHGTQDYSTSPGNMPHQATCHWHLPLSGEHFMYIII